MEISAGSRLPLIAESFERFAGRPLVEPSPGGIEEALWFAPCVIIAHGTEPVPRIFYANRAALDLYEITAPAFIGMLSHLCAEPVRRHERTHVLNQLKRHNLVEVNSGVRIASSGRRIAIELAHAWNLLDKEGQSHGVAACYQNWRHLDPA